MLSVSQPQVSANIASTNAGRPRVPYEDKTGPAVPQWYADYRYNPDKSFRESYIDNSLEPMFKANSFYTMRANMRRKQLEEAKLLEKIRQQRIQERQLRRKLINWRDRVKYVL